MESDTGLVFLIVLGVAVFAAAALVLSSGDRGSGRYTVLLILTTVFQIWCGLMIALGLLLVLLSFSRTSDTDVLSRLQYELAARLGVAAGIPIIFFGLAGVIFSGAINVLVGIYESRLATAMASSSASADNPYGSRDFTRGLEDLQGSARSLYERNPMGVAIMLVIAAFLLGGIAFKFGFGFTLMVAASIAVVVLIWAASRRSAEPVSHRFASLRASGAPPVQSGGSCTACGTRNDADARFCGNCGVSLATSL